ncbi:GNAT family N-acetyltransferase [Niallia sp. FSL R7-0271]|uniref:GNAT family N-acetyltransferase n=1 Tax=Niallia sp. FSL R7-0271 TaxID=2921678 RepID=UPI0030FD1B0E
MHFKIEAIKTTKEFNKVKALISESFPRNEQIPFWFLLWKSKKNFVDLLGVYADNSLVGFIYLITHKDLTFVLYFAIDNKHRSKGFGSMAISKLREYCPNNRIMLNIEAVKENASNYEQRVKRKKFYINNGFKNASLMIEENSNNLFEVLVNNSDVTVAEYTNLLKRFTGRLLYLFFKPKFIR